MKETFRDLFPLIDGYARERHNSFLAEFFYDETKHHMFFLCFRPQQGDAERHRYACRYLQVEESELRIFQEANAMSAGLASEIDEALISLNDELKA
jgi:hypothetical protein